jgi:poly-gamma-glutamate system protein
LNNSSRTIRIVAAGILSLAALWIVRILPPGEAPDCAEAMARAEQIMERAILAVRAHHERGGIAFQLQIDPNRTGLIGPEASPLMTTLGELEAKRSTANPNIAGLLVYLLYQAGVRPGDSIAIGSSGSFPALLVASLAAARAMNAQPITILSLGASAYGATDPGFNLLDLYNVMLGEGICDAAPAAVSLGGEGDTGLDMEAEFRDRLAARLRAGKFPFLHQPDLAKNVSERLRMYESQASGKIAAFINSGGGYANLGTSRLALDVRPGLNMNLPLPAAEQRGVLFEMSARKVPVIHLLYIKGLVTDWGLPWDPIPLPQPGRLRLPGTGRYGSFWMVSVTYLALLLFLVAHRR